MTSNNMSKSDVEYELKLKDEPNAVTMMVVLHIHSYMYVLNNPYIYEVIKRHFIRTFHCRRESKRSLDAVFF